MLGRGVLSRLHCLTQQESSTLTLYLDVDQNKQANRNRGFAVQAEALLKELKAKNGRDQQLSRAATRALDLVEDLEPSGRSALVVVHPDSGLSELHQLSVGLPVSAHWGRGAFLRPVVEAMDEHERYGVVLTDTNRARLFTVYLGEIVEHEDLISPTSPRTRALGTDQWRSQKRQDRRHEEETAYHAKRVIDALHDLSLEAPFDRLIVAGPKKATAQLIRLLPRRLHGKLVETISMPMGAAKSDILEGILAVQDRMEREQEQALVEGIIGELHEGGKAVAGLASVVAAVNQARVWKMAYIKDFKTTGGECRGCASFTVEQSGVCSSCGGAVQAVPNFVDRLNQSVLEVGGQVEVVDGAAAVALAKQGSIAALLRY
jgi:peptide chain release factor subunit 1